MDGQLADIEFTQWETLHEVWIAFV
ncbi:MAG: hypothetical protein ACI9DC_004698 [Gammaproteobacteria bacterium]